MLLPNPTQRYEPQAQAAANQILMQADAQNIKRNLPAELGAVTVNGRLLVRNGTNPFVELNDGTGSSFFQIVGGIPFITTSAGDSCSFGKGQIIVAAQDTDLKGGELTLVGGPNAVGADFRTWHLDNWNGYIRFYEGSTVHAQIAHTGVYFVFQIFDQLELNGTSAAISWYEGDQALNEKRWDMVVDGKTFFCRTVSDDYTTATNIFTVVRGTGQAVLGFRFNCNVDFLTDNTYDIGTSGNRARFVDAGTGFKVAGTQVLSTRKTGWTAATGTAQRGTFATGTVTLPNLAQAVKAIIDDLIAHGVIGA